MRTIYGSVENAVLGRPQSASRTKTASELRGFDFEEREGYLYVAVRAVSSRVNKNYDAFTVDELKRAYKTFEGRPVYVNHHNTDTQRARGVILQSELHEDKSETWVELLLEMDSVTYPSLCSAIQNGDIDTVSMGCSVSHTTCSVCGNKARFASEFCEHINRKGVTFPVTQDDGSTGMVLAFEYCYGVDFFEISWVFDPADSSAVVQGIMNESRTAMAKVAQNELRSPEPVDTLHAAGPCPQCGSESWDGIVCEVCGWANEPESTGAPDTDKAKETDIPVTRVEPEMVAEPEVTEGPPAWGSGDDGIGKPEAWSLDERKTEKGGVGMARSNTAARRARIAGDMRRRWAQTGEQPDAAPEETAVDTSADDRVDVETPGAVMPVDGPDTTTTVDAPGAEITDVSADTNIDVTGDSGSVPVAEVDEVVLPVATDPGGDAPVANPTVLPEAVLSARRKASAKTVLFMGLRLAEARKTAGLEPANINLSVLANKLASAHSIGEMRAMTRLLEEVSSKSAKRIDASLVPRRANRRTAGITRKATKRTPDEALFG